MKEKLPRHRCAGWLLIEILVVLALFGVFSLVASKLFVATTRATSGVERIQGEIARFDAAVSHLRRDVWGASEIRVVDPMSLSLRFAGGQVVTWQVVDRSTSLARTVGNDAQRFDEVGQALRFEAAPVSTVLIASPTDAVAQEARIRLASQLLLVEGVR